MVPHRFLAFFKRNRILFALILGSTLGIFQTRLVASTFLMNLEQIQVTRVLVQSDVYRGAECGVPGILGSSRVLLAMADTWNPNDARMNYRWGTLDWLEGDCNSALAFWQANRDAPPPINTWSSLALARGYFALGQRDHAIAIFKEAHLVVYLYKLGYGLEVTKDRPAAIKMYELTLDVQPTREALDRLVELYTLRNDPNAIRNMWNRVISNADSPAELHWLGVAELASLNQDWDKAVLAYQQALNQPNLNIDTQYDLDLRIARMLGKNQRQTEAIQVYQEAIRIAPFSKSEPYRAVGEILAHEGDQAGSASWFDRARQIFPRDPFPDIHQGVVAMKLGKIEQAKQWFNAALAIAPGNVQALMELGRLEEQEGNLLGAIGYLERANSPMNCDAASVLEELYREQGSIDKATRLANQVAPLCQR